MNDRKDIGPDKSADYTAMITLFLLVYCPICLRCLEIDPGNCAVSKYVTEWDDRLKFMPSEQQVRLAVPGLKPEVIEQVESILDKATGGG